MIHNTSFRWVVGFFLGVLLVVTGCKEPETRIVPDNDAPYYDQIPTAVVRNYVNRMYIDLIGREPLTTEMDRDVNFLKDNELTVASRDSLLRMLQFNTDYIDGDSSYSRAYFHRFYEMSKARLLEGAADTELAQQQNISLNAATVDSLNGDSVGMEENKAKAQLYANVLQSDYQYFTGQITFRDMYFAMLYNGIYDRINMNTFNFINATFDDLFFRYPTEEEYDNAFDMIEYNLSGMIFQQSGQNKVDYCNILLETREYYEGMIRWAYLSLAAREPTTVELSEQMNTFFIERDIQAVQRSIMRSDEYAKF